MYPCQKAGDVYSCPVLAGHTHCPQSFSKVSSVEDSHTEVHGVDSSRACDPNPGYLEDRTLAGVNCFVVIETWDGGNVKLYEIIVSGGQCSFGERVYGR